MNREKLFQWMRPLNLLRERLDASGKSLGVVGANNRLRPYGGREHRTKTRIVASANDGINVAGGWSNATGAGGPTLTLETSDIRVPGRPVLKLAAGPTGTSVYTTTRKKIPLRAIAGRFEIWIKVPEYTAGSVNASIIYSSDVPANDPPTAAATNRRTFVFNTSLNRKGMWQCMHVDITGTSTNTPGGANWTDTGSPVANQCGFIELVVNCNSATPDGQRYILFDIVGIGGRATPIIMLGSDGAGYTSSLTVAAPLLNARGLKAYKAVDADAIAANQLHLDQLYDRGWDIMTQGIGHIDYAANPSQLAIDLPSALATMRAAGYLRGINCFAYPSNSANRATRDILVANGIEYGRAANAQQIVLSSEGMQDFSWVGCYDMGQKTGQQMIDQVEAAKLHGTSLNMMFHDLVSGAADTGVKTATSEFTTFADYYAAEVAAGRVIGATPSEFLEMTRAF